MFVVDTLCSTFSTAMDYIEYLTGFFISIDVEFWKHCICKIFRKNAHRFSPSITASKIIYQYLFRNLLRLAFYYC